MKKIIALGAVAIFLSGFLVLHTQASSDLGSERILNYNSDIVVSSDSSMTVTEDIKVVATNDTINHGIYRDFPTKYKDANGNSYVVDFSVISAERDGSPEKYSIENISNGVRVYLGDASFILSPGVYDYKIEYKTGRQLGYFADYDELYWNVTGNGWDYVIEQASATVHLPSGISVDNITTYGYTGVFGSKGGDYTAEKTIDGINFKVTRNLQPYEGLTIVAGWPKGFVHEPTAQEKNALFIRDNIAMAFAFLLLIGLFLYYFIEWWKVGRDPKRGTIIPQYEPPQDLSPAEINYQNKMGYKKTALTAAVLGMAVKGFLIITEEKGPFGFGKQYTLTKASKSVILNPGEQVIADSIFRGNESFVLKQSNYLLLQEGEDNLKKGLKEKLGGMFVRNYSKLVIGILLSLVVLFVGCLAVGSLFAQGAAIGFLLVWFAGWTCAVVALLRSVIESFSSKRKLSGLFLLVLALPFFGAEIFVFGLIISMSTHAFSTLIVAVVVTNVVFVSIMPRRTIEGRKLQDEVEGFKWFLSVTEKDRMNFQNPPGKTPQLFEKFLPYALALGVEQKWAMQFTRVFEAMAQSGGATYTPVWYVGSAFNAASIGSFTSGLSSSFASAISSSSTAPGSSGGGGGGGSSGGGGGGGGGGGW